MTKMMTVLYSEGLMRKTLNTGITEVAKTHDNRTPVLYSVTEVAKTQYPQI